METSSRSATLSPNWTSYSELPDGLDVKTRNQETEVYFASSGSDEDGDRELHVAASEEKDSIRCKWGKRAVSVVGFAGSLTLSAMNLYLWTNALGSFGAGFFTMCAVSIVSDPHSLTRVRQVALTAFGAYAGFAASQVYANVESRPLQIGVDNTLVGMLGANIQIILAWLIEQRGSRNESQSVVGQYGEKLSRYQLVGYNSSHVLKVCAAIGFGTGYFFLSDPIFRGISSFFASFFASQVVGERTIDLIDKKIDKSDPQEGSSFRVGKIALLSLAYIGKIFCFVPWNNPDTTGRIRQLFGFGFALGFFDGFSTRSIVRRFEQIPVRDLEEFNELKAPQKPAGKLCENKNVSQKMSYLAHKVWTFAVPTICALSLIGFTIWQEGWNLESSDAKITMGALLGGFGIGLPLFKWIDERWSQEKRSPAKDEGMLSLWSSFRILGIDPLYLYFAVTNSLKMDSNAVGSAKSPYHVAAILAGWGAYTLKMAHEFTLTSSDRVGSPQVKLPQLALINALATLRFYLAGKN